MAQTLTAKVQRTPIPVNRIASAVIRPGIHYEENFESRGEFVSEAPLPVRPYPRSAHPSDDLSGKKIGRFTVIGLSAQRDKTWVVKCSCGRYCFRKAKALKQINFNAPGGHLQVMCVRCLRQAQLKNKPAPRSECVKNLHGASLPLFRAIEDILKNGLSNESRDRGIRAMKIATGQISRKEAPEEIPLGPADFI